MLRFVLLCCFIQGGTLLAGPCVPSCSFDELRQLCIAEVLFDYCGMEAETAQTNHVGASEERIRFLAASGLSGYAIRKEFLADVRRLEKSAADGDRTGMSNMTGRIAMRLEGLAAHSSTNAADRLLMQSLIERTEYSLVRVMERTRPCPLSTENVVGLLPDKLFEDLRRGTCFDRGRKLKAFRDLILVGMCINRHCHETGRCPESLDELAVPQEARVGKSGMKVRYSFVGDVWQLLFSGPCLDERELEFNVYIPTVDDNYSYCWRYGGCIWLSSTYSHKRKTLYLTGVLNEHSPRWNCKMENGVLSPLSIQTNRSPKDGLR